MILRWSWIIPAIGQLLCLLAGPAVESAAFSLQPDDNGRIAGDGYLVWESNRTGAWRIWTCRLDRSGLKQLTPDVNGRQLCCPHISPDGTRIAYASFPEKADTYRDGLAVGELHLIKPDGSGDTVIPLKIRTYGENRAVVWKSTSELIYISGDGYTMLLDLATGKSKRLIRDPCVKNGYLINATLTCATTGTPVFAAFDKKKGIAGEPGKCGGCATPARASPS